MYASTAALVRGRPEEGYEWRWYAALLFRMLVPYFGQVMIEMLCSEMHRVSSCTYIDSSLVRCPFPHATCAVFAVDIRW